MAQSHRPAKVVTPTVLTRSQSDEIIIHLDRHAVDLQHERWHLITVEMKSSLRFEGQIAPWATQ